MKEKLLQLLSTHPATAGRPSDFLDTLAEDLQAVMIRAIQTDAGLDITAELEARALDIYNDHFGVKLSNLVTIEPFLGKKKLYFSARRRVTLAMIQTMLVEQQDQYDRNDSEQAGEVMKHRLADLTPKAELVH